MPFPFPRLFRALRKRKSDPPPTSHLVRVGCSRSRGPVSSQAASRRAKAGVEHSYRAAEGTSNTMRSTQLLSVTTATFMAMLSGCASTKHWFEEPFYEIELRDPQKVLSGPNARLNVVAHSNPRACMTPADLCFSDAEQIYRVDSLLHGARDGWLLASPDIRAPHNEIKRYVFEFHFHQPQNSDTWSDWMPVDFMLVGGNGDWHLIYKTGRESRLQPPEDTGLQMRHRTTSWDKIEARSSHKSPDDS